MLYYLLGLLVVALGFSFAGILPYNPFTLLFSTIFIIAVSFVTNSIFAYVFEAPTNVESVYITAFILALIITPENLSKNFFFLMWAAVWAMASKYIFAIGKKHLFNPAALAVALTALAINQSASWWVGGNIPMMPFILLGGFLMVRKIRRVDLVVSFFVAALITIAGTTILRGNDLVAGVTKALLHAPIFFFAFVMLTEPLTTPPTKILRIYYGALVGFLFAPAIHIGSIYSTPELALLVGNLFSYIVSPKEKLLLKLKRVVKLAADTYDFIFTSTTSFNFKPGQYLEWTLAHHRPDRRGNRRYFTIASSPTEQEIHLGVKFYRDPSSFKQALADLPIGGNIIASQRAGDFVLQKNKDEKLVFIAGGIGITPFRSMIKYLLDRNERRDIVLLYSNKTTSEISYQDIFDSAASKLGIKTIYTLTDTTTIPRLWHGEKGIIDKGMIAKYVPDHQERMFYLSGPHAMVTSFEKTLKAMGVGKRRIKTDFFPGFA